MTATCKASRRRIRPRSGSRRDFDRQSGDEIRICQAHEQPDQEMERLINAIFWLCLFISFDLQNW
jgi:hypothetical protein